MIVIGLTGGIGTGKTEVAKVLGELGVEVISADEVAHETYRRGTQGWREVVAEFGGGVLGPDGEVDRRKLGEVVFRDERALERLNAIVHPKVRAAIEARLREQRDHGTKAVVVEAALLIEAKRQDARWTTLVDEVWVTDAPETKVVERVRARDSVDTDGVRARVLAQMPRAERVAEADVVIENSGTLEELRTKLRGIWVDRLAALET